MPHFSVTTGSCFLQIAMESLKALAVFYLYALYRTSPFLAKMTERPKILFRAGSPLLGHTPEFCTTSPPVKLIYHLEASYCHHSICVPKYVLSFNLSPMHTTPEYTEKITFLKLPTAMMDVCTMQQIPDKTVNSVRLSTRDGCVLR